MTSLRAGLTSVTMFVFLLAMRCIDVVDENDDVDSVVVLLPALWILNKRNDAIRIKRN